ncbi:Prosaposin-like protein [Drosera capensis]
MSQNGSKPTMDRRVGLMFLLMLAVNLVCDARDLPSSDISGVKETTKKIDVCTLCEEYATVALDYLSEDKTQTEVIEVLHEACSQLHSLAQECVTVVDHYLPLFFSEISLVDADDFCKKVNLCGTTKISSLLVKVDDDKCDICNHAVDEIKTKLKDPDAKLEIIEALLKECDAMKSYAKKCKTLVFEFGPLILANAEKFLDKTDICIASHACSASTAENTSEDLEDGKILMMK